MFQDLLHFVSEQSKPKQLPLLKAGYTVKVHQKIKEGNKERIQGFVGLIIKINSGNGVDSTFTVRKIGANAVAVEKIFPYYSPMIKAIDFVRRGDVRRAKLYFMRDRIGKAARVKEKVMTKVQKAAEMKKVAEKTIK